MSHVVRIGLLAALAMAAYGCASDVRAPSPVMSVFTSHQVWDSDNGTTIERLELPQQAIFHVDQASGATSRIPFTEGWGVGDAAASYTGERIAFTRFAGDNGRDFGVVVADIAGQPVAWFPKAMQFAWSPDRDVLAMRITHSDSPWDHAADSLAIWRRDGKTQRYSLRPDDIAWGSRDTLFLGYPEGVDALVATTGAVARTLHRAAHVSPDGMFSFRIDTRPEPSLVLYEERTGLDLSRCAARDGYTVGFGFSPFWVRTPGAGHHLCVMAVPENAAAPGPASPLRQHGCTTHVFDIVTLETVQSFPGKPVAPTTDGRGVAVLRDDALSIVAFEPPPADSAGARVRVRMEVRPWTSWTRQQPPGRVYIEEAEVHEWLPDRTDLSTGCDRAFRVTRVVGRDSVEVEIGSGWGLAPTDSTGGVARPSGPGRIWISRAPTQLSTHSLDGGYTLSLSTVP